MPICEHCQSSKGLIRWNRNLRIYEHLGSCEMLGFVSNRDVNEVFSEGITNLLPKPKLMN